MVSENDRAAVRRNGFGHPAGRRCKEKRVLLNFARPTMPIRSPLPAAIAALLCISLPAGGQDDTPDRARKTGTVAPTSVGVSFKEWTVPTPRSFPHDPLAAADGAIWYTGQMASTLGRLDPKTGAFKEYRTKTPDSGPHGLAADKDGNIWFTASFQGYIGKLVLCLRRVLQVAGQGAVPPDSIE